LLDVHATGRNLLRPYARATACGGRLPEPSSGACVERGTAAAGWDAYLLIAAAISVLAERTFPGIALAVGYPDRH